MGLEAGDLLAQFVIQLPLMSEPKLISEMAMLALFPLFPPRSWQTEKTIKKAAMQITNQGPGTAHVQQSIGPAESEPSNKSPADPTATPDLLDMHSSTWNFATHNSLIDN